MDLQKDDSPGAAFTLEKLFFLVYFVQVVSAVLNKIVSAVNILKSGISYWSAMEGWSPTTWDGRH